MDLLGESSRNRGHAQELGRRQKMKSHITSLVLWAIKVFLRLQPSWKVTVFDQIFIKTEMNDAFTSAVLWGGVDWVAPVAPVASAHDVHATCLHDIHAAHVGHCNLCPWDSHWTLDLQKNINDYGLQIKMNHVQNQLFHLRNFYYLIECWSLIILVCSQSQR